jgi:hypothetical protein
MSPVTSLPSLIKKAFAALSVLLLMQSCQTPKEGETPVPRLMTLPRYVAALNTDATIGLYMQKTAALFVGRFTEGSEEMFRRFLAENPQVTDIVFTSKGGYVPAAIEIGEIIGKRGLRTYIYAYCISACTFAFAHGKKRTLIGSAHTGFHHPSWNSTTALYSDILKSRLDVYTYRVKIRFEKLGLVPTFIDNIFNTPFEDMWTPTDEQMLAGGFIHETSQESPFQFNEYP